MPHPVTTTNPKEPTVAENDAPQPKPTLAERYPELEKQRKVTDKSQAIGEFLDWAETEKGYSLSSRASAHGIINDSVEELLAEFFEIDLKVIEQERRALIAEISG